LSGRVLAGECEALRSNPSTTKIILIMIIRIISEPTRCIWLRDL
jgi:hypothetical protein